MRWEKKDWCELMMLLRVRVGGASSRAEEKRKFRSPTLCAPQRMGHPTSKAEVKKVLTNLRVCHPPSKVIQVLKQSVSRRLRSKSRRESSPNQLRLGFAGAERLQHLWQRRFYDFNVWSYKKKLEKLKYMHSNPVKRGLVKDPKEWPWSSYSFYEGSDDGMLKMDCE
jgi:hypothetical protein